MGYNALVPVFPVLWRYIMKKSPFELLHALQLNNAPSKEMLKRIYSEAHQEGLRYLVTAAVSLLGGFLLFFVAIYPLGIDNTLRYWIGIAGLASIFFSMQRMFVKTMPWIEVRNLAHRKMKKHSVAE